jgi:hypothetical protein
MCETLDSISISIHKMSVHRLNCLIQDYAWGKHGDQSSVAKFAANACSTPAAVSPDRPYAEVRFARH